MIFCFHLLKPFVLEKRPFFFNFHWSYIEKHLSKVVLKVYIWNFINEPITSEQIKCFGKNECTTHSQVQRFIIQIITNWLLIFRVGLVSTKKKKKQKLTLSPIISQLATSIINTAQTRRLKINFLIITWKYHKFSFKKFNNKNINNSSEKIHSIYTTLN